MLKNDIDLITRRERVRSNRLYGDAIGFSCFDEAPRVGSVGAVIPPCETDSSIDPALTELLDLSGALSIADAAWLCRIGGGGSIALLAHRGNLFADEVASVLESLAGPINFEHASAPFRWLSGGREYIICTIGEMPEGSALLVMRANRRQVGDWPKVQETAARAQRLMSICLSMGECTPSSTAVAPQAEALARGMMDILPFGVVVVDINQTMLLANDAMRGFFAETHLLANLGGKLAVLNSDDAVRFHVALGAVISKSAGGNQPQTIALANERGRAPASP
jgi:hypothetical protein